MRVNFNMWAVFSVARQPSHVVVPSKYCHFIRSSLHSLLRRFQVVHRLPCTLARLSSRLTEVRWRVLIVLHIHSLHLMTLEGKFAGLTESRK